MNDNSGRPDLSGILKFDTSMLKKVKTEDTTRLPTQAQIEDEKHQDN